MPQERAWVWAARGTTRIWMDSRRSTSPTMESWTRTCMMSMETWIMETARAKCCLLRPMSILDRLMELAVRRDRRESLLLLSLECWWRVRLGLKGQQVSLDPQVLLAHQAALEILERGVLLVVLVFLVLMVGLDPLEPS